MTTAEVQTLLRVSRPTLARWREDGTLPALKLGRLVRYKRSDVLALLTPTKDGAA
jgi:excisionase family DNA binding protein